MNATLPRTIPDYLDQLRAALAGADPALVQDAGQLAKHLLVKVAQHA